MQIKYGLDDKLKTSKTIIFGLQWITIIIPFILIFGKLVGVLEIGTDYIPYLQKLFLLMGILILVQVLWGHKLPLVMGPSAVLLISILTSFNQGIGAINSSIIIGGFTLAVLAASGLFRHIKKLFTSRVIIVILMLISFTLTPTIVNLVSSGGQVPASYNLVFSLGFLFFSAAVSISMETPEGLQGIITLLTMPIFFASNALYPITAFPPFLQELAKWNPLTHLIIGIRYFAIGDDFYSIGVHFSATPSDILLSFGVLAGFALSMFVLAWWRFREAVVT